MKPNTVDYKYTSILLVDDEALDNFVNEKLLAANHFAETIYVNSGAKSALEFIENLLSAEVAQERLPQVIFIDLNMPMMSGFQFITALQKTLAKRKSWQPKLVVLTSSAFPSDQQQAADLSPDIIFLVKPLLSEMLQSI